MQCQAFDRDQYQSIVNGFDTSTTDATVADGISDVATEAGAPTGRCLVRTVPPNAGCQSAVFPTAPESLQARPSNGRTYVYALRSIQFGPGAFGNWANYGFDIDGVCTSPVAPNNEGCANTSIIADGIDGRDNGFAATLGSLLFVSDIFRDDTTTESINSGMVVPALRVTEWNGSDDRNITLEWLTVVQGRSSNGGPRLAWDGRDTWNIDHDTTFDENGQAFARTTEAFYACNWLVARTPQPIILRMPQNGALRGFSMRNVHIAGEFDPERGGTLDLTAVATVSDITTDFHNYECLGDALTTQSLNRATAQISASLDVRLDLARDRTLPCDAMSLGFRLQFAPITVVDTVVSPRGFLHPCERGEDGGLADAEADAGSDAGDAGAVDQDADGDGADGE